MDKTNTPPAVACFIGAEHLRPSDPWLRSQGLVEGMIIFGIPHYGVQFKCRVEGDLIDLEFAAFFALLRTITTRLKDEAIRSVEVFSSNPEFVFAFTGRSKHLEDGSERVKLIKEYSQKLNISVRLVDRRHNEALRSPAEYPALPTNRYVAMKPDPFEHRKVRIGPFLRGVEL